MIRVGLFFLFIGAWGLIVDYFTSQLWAAIVGWLLILGGFRYIGYGLLGEPDQESHMNEIVSIDNQIQSVHWKLKGSTSPHGQVSKPNGHYEANLQKELAKLEGQRVAFWQTHHYEHGRRGGKIIEGGPGPYREDYE